jgi:hypothetical protein
MKKTHLPQTDSIKTLAEFWNRHDVTEFEDELEEVAAPVFVRGTSIKVPLAADEVEAIERFAGSEGLSREELIRAWVIQEVSRRQNGQSGKAPAG